MTGVTVLKLVDPIYTILMEFESLRELLETLYDRYNRTEFIAPDPISVPHRFEGREDREIAGFLSATIAWGNRRAIVGNACRMMSYMDNAPADFVKNASEEELRKLTVCVHRTFNGEDLIAYVRALRSLFRRYGSLGEFFEGRYAATGSIPSVLSDFRREFFAEPHPPRSEKHLSSIDKGSACKRLNMFLRWMVRRDDRGRGFRALALDPHVGALSAARPSFGRRGTGFGIACPAAERLAGRRGDYRRASHVRPGGSRAL